MNKVEGAYYTPRYLSDYLVELSFKNIKKNENEIIKILEPSCGDGVFIKSLLNTNNIAKEIIGVEKNKNELDKVKKVVNSNISKNDNVCLYNIDFLDYILETKEKFDLIIGNPPYIQKKLMSKSQLDKAKAIVSDLSINTIYNIWIPFVVASINLLNNNGILCLVLPSEMLQVKYADSIRKLIYSNFPYFKIISFDFNVFPEIDQDVVILLGIKNKPAGLSFETLTKDHSNNLKLLSNIEVDSSKKYDKWLWFTLEKEEILLLNKIEQKVVKISNVCESTAGIVTGNNNFFILSANDLTQFGLKEYGKPILKRSLYSKNTINFTELDFNELLKGKEGTYLLDFNALPQNLNHEVINYIDNGQQIGIHKGYKCSIRNLWYEVPSIWKSEGFIFKRAHTYPKILVNSADVYVTDTAYRIKMKEGYNIKNLVFSFYNSYTLSIAELKGRKYGGGVLEITPSEFRDIDIPYTDISSEQFNMLDNLFRKKAPIEEILDYTDSIILKDNLGLKDSEIEKIKSIREKLVKIRIS